MKQITRIKCIISIASIIIAAMGVISYLFDIRLLASLHKDFIPMAPSTSVSFIILGLIILFYNLIIKNKIICFIILILTVLVTLFGLLEIPGHFYNIDLNFEDFFVPNYGKLGVFPIARMSPITGFFFFITGISVILLLSIKLTKKNGNLPEHIAGLLSSIAFICSGTILLSYLHPTPILYATEAIPMALSTAICFLFLTLSIVLSFSNNIFPINIFLGTSTQIKLIKIFIPVTVGAIIIIDIIVQDILIYYFNLHSAIIETTLIVISALITGFIVIILSKKLGKNIDYYQNAINNAQSKVVNIAKFPEENPSPVLRISKYKKVLYANKASKVLLTSENLSTGNEFKLWADIINKALSTNKQTYSEKSFFNIYWYAWNFVPIIGENYINIYGINITKRKQSELKLKESFENSVYMFSKATEKRDPYTAGHQLRVAKLAIAIAEKMKLTEDQIKTIYYGSMIHDIGKLYTPSDILNKPGRLSDSEMNIIREHPKTGYDTVKDIDFNWPLKEIILHHHEKLNGSGYPDGLKNKSINLACRIVCVADTIEAMNNHRPYRKALGIAAALNEIKNGRKLLYDPHVVDACVDLFEKENFKFEE